MREAVPGELNVEKYKRIPINEKGLSGLHGKKLLTVNFDILIGFSTSKRIT